MRLSKGQVQSVENSLPDVCAALRGANAGQHQRYARLHAADGGGIGERGFPGNEYDSNVITLGNPLPLSPSSFRGGGTKFDALFRFASPPLGRCHAGPEGVSRRVNDISMIPRMVCHYCTLEMTDRKESVSPATTPKRSFMAEIRITIAITS